MPQVQELPSGRFRVRWFDAAGNRHSPGFSFPNKTAARKYGQDREAEVRRGEGRDPRAGRDTLAVWIEQWWDSRVGEDRTLAEDRASLDRYVLEGIGGAKPLGDLRLEQVDEMAIQSWVKRLERLTDEHDPPRPLLAPATILRHYRTLSAVLRPAIRARKIPTDPLLNITLPTVPPADDFYWEPDEVDAIRAKLTDVHDRALFELLLGTGMRWGEVVGLHLDRWQPLRRRVTVARVVVERKGMRLKEYPKGKSRRELPIDEYLVEVVAAHLAARPAADCGLDHGRGRRCPGVLFHFRPQRGARAGIPGPLSRFSWPREVFDPAVAAAGVRRGTVHDLRHTYASQLVIDGVPLRIVQELLGHASIRTTERYSHLAPSALDHPALAASLAKRRPPSVATDVATPSADG